jgi:NAD(P)-dependent dehydrogenase (short-subunit alcohol dehydrogenase family)
MDKRLCPTPAVLRAMTEATPLRRVAEPEEMVGTLVFLASKHAGYIPGAPGQPPGLVAPSPCAA